MGVRRGRRQSGSGIKVTDHHGGPPPHLTIANRPTHTHEVVGVAAPGEQTHRAHEPALVGCNRRDTHTQGVTVWLASRQQMAGGVAAAAALPQHWQLSRLASWAA